MAYVISKRNGLCIGIPSDCIGVMSNLTIGESSQNVIAPINQKTLNEARAEYKRFTKTIGEHQNIDSQQLATNTPTKKFTSSIDLIEENKNVEPVQQEVVPEKGPAPRSRKKPAEVDDLI